MPSFRFAGGITLCVALCAGCAVTTSSGDGTDDHVTLASEPTMLTYVDPAGVQGLNPETISGESRQPHMHLTYPTLADTPVLNKRLHTDMTKAANHYATHTKTADRFPAPEYNVDWQLTAASPDVVGVRLRTGEYAGTRWANSTRTLWYDRPAGRVLGSAQLVNDLDLLAALVKQHLALDPAVDTEAVRPDPLLFDSLDFNSRGDLVAEFDDYQVAPGSMGRIATAIPRKDADALLTPFGRRARHAVENAKPATVPEIVAMSGGGGRSGPNTGTPDLGTISDRKGRVNCALATCVALTFDDGPGPNTARVLEALGDNRATFFTVGSNAAVRPELLARMRERGHEVANHTWTHRDLTTLPENRVYDQLSRTQSFIKGITGNRPTLVRAPYGAIDPKVTDVARELGLAVVQWNVDPKDWRVEDPGAIAARTLAGVRRNSIVLLHDTNPATADAIPAIVAGLAARGFTLVTVPELYGPGQLAPGHTYDAGGTAAVSRRGHPLP
ncbi:polysaccharide deacetylase family protein [Acrocarpospora pleiomorpha]|nr:polysaccharide deacetylase family protein [Acrocarpospora pleiomorpha]